MKLFFTLLVPAFLLALILFVPFGLAANDPGHDTLYIEQTGDSNLTGSLNISANLTVGGQSDISSFTLIGDGSAGPAGGSYIATAAGGTDWMRIDAPGNVYLKYGGGDQVQVGTGALFTDLNVTGVIYEQNVRVCLSNGTNCIGGNNTGNVSAVTAGDGLVDAGTASNPILNLVVDRSLNVSSDLLTINYSYVCTTENGLCSGTASGWTDNNPNVALTDSSDNVSAGTLFIDNTNNSVGIGTQTPVGQLNLNQSKLDTRQIVLRNEVSTYSTNAYISSWGDGLYLESNHFWNGSHQTDNASIGSSAIILQNALNDAYIWFGTAATGGVQTERMRIMVDGNVSMDTNTFYLDAGNNRVGIGTSTPSEELSVTGNISATVDVCIVGGNCLSSVSGGSGNASWNESYADTLYAPISITGYVTSTGATTDNAIARWSGTSGDTIQPSGVTIDDNDDITVPGGRFTGANSEYIAMGEVNNQIDIYSSGTLSVRIDTSDNFGIEGSLYDITNSILTVNDDLNVTGRINATTDVCITGGACLSTAGASEATVEGYIFDTDNTGSLLTTGTLTASNLNTSSDRVYVGTGAGYLNTVNSVTLVGYNAGWNNTGQLVTALGMEAGANNTQDYSLFVGAYAGSGNTGQQATAIGFTAGQDNTGNYLTAIGFTAGQENSAEGLTVVGNGAGYQNGGEYSTLVGRDAGYGNDGIRVVAIGSQAGYNNEGHNTTAIGHQTGFQNQGNNSIFIGQRAGFQNAINSQFILRQYSTNTIPLISGNFSSGNVGIGYVNGVNPTTKLGVNGSINVTSGNDICISGGNCLSSVGSGSGNVSGSGATTDNTIARWSGTGGGTIQQSGVTISDTNDITTTGSIFSNEMNVSGGNWTILGDQAGQSNTGVTLTAFGYQAAENNSGIGTLAIGYQAGVNNSARHLIAIGERAGHNNTGIASILIGEDAGENNSGTATAIGSRAGTRNTGSGQFIGAYAGIDNTGNDVTGIGTFAGQENSGNYAIFMGWYAGYQNQGNYTVGIGSALYQNNANYATAVGYSAGESNQGESLSTYGYFAGYENTGENVTSMGFEAGRGNDGDNNILIGHEAGENYAISNQFVVKHNAVNTIPLILGNFSSGNVGIGYVDGTNPTVKLGVNGSINVISGNDICISGGNCLTDIEANTDTVRSELSVESAIFDGDNKHNLVTSGYFEGTTFVLEQNDSYIAYKNSNGSVTSTVKIADGTNNGPTLDGGDEFGYSMTNIGDFNKDGVTDIAVGTRQEGPTSEGAVYLLFLYANGTVNTSVIISNNENGGPSLDFSDLFGTSVENIGDFNGDGIIDLAVGAMQDEGSGTSEGAVHILFMNANGSAASTVKITDGQNGGPALDDGDNFGYSIANIGDLNGDGIIDLAVGAQTDEGTGSAEGAVHILFMNANGSAASTVKITDGQNGGPTLDDNDDFGTSIANMGDLDGDGIVDIAVGARLDEDDFATSDGAIYLLYLHANGSAKRTVKITDGINNGPVMDSGDGFGTSVANIGDINGDGITDIAVGSSSDEGTGTSEGAIHILFMQRNGTVESSIKIANGDNGGPSTANFDAFGASIVNMGDLNGDGITDLAVSAYSDDEGAGDEGSLYILYLTDNSQFRIMTGDTERFTITQSGDVGIGTTTPTQKLDVNGNINVSGYINVTSGNDICISGGNCLSTVGSGTSGWTDQAPNVTLTDPTDNVSAGALFIDNTNSYVSIGNSSADSALMVQGNITPGLNNTYTLGTPEKVWAEGYFGPNSVYIGGTTLSNNAGILEWGGVELIQNNSGYVNVTTDVCIIGGNCLSTVGGGATGWTDNNPNVALTDSSDNVTIGNVFIDNTNNYTGIGNVTPGATLEVLASAPTADEIVLRIGTSDDYDRFTVDEDGDVFAFGTLRGSNFFVNTTAVVVAAGAPSVNAGTSSTLIGNSVATGNTGNALTAVGERAGFNNGGDYAISIGISAGEVNTGDNVTSIGYFSGYVNSGSNSILIGDHAGFLNSADNQFILEQGHLNDIPLISGNFSSGNVGIGYVVGTNPLVKLGVNGSVNVTAGNDICISGGNCLSSVSGDNSSWNETLADTLYAPISITGNVTGAGATTDNAIARWSGTGGDTIQNSGVTIDDNDDITVPGGRFTGANSEYIAIGEVDNVISFVAGAGNGAIIDASGNFGIEGNLYDITNTILVIDDDVNVTAGNDFCISGSGTCLSTVSGGSSVWNDTAGDATFIGGNVGIGTDDPDLFTLQIKGNIGPNQTDDSRLGEIETGTMDNSIGSTADASWQGWANNFRLGWAITGVGDVNGDGYDDVVLAGNGQGGQNGEAFLILGNATGWSMDNNISAVANASWESAVTSVEVYVAGPGDVNGDGYDDILISDTESTGGGSFSGEVYLIFGSKNNWQMEQALDSVANASWHGSTNEQIGRDSLGKIGDVDGDGYDDIYIGKQGGLSSSSETSFIIFGKKTGWSSDVSVSSVADATFVNGAPRGIAGGDLNADGYDDMILGFETDAEHGSGTGQVYVYLGRNRSEWSTGINLSTDADASYYGEALGDDAGMSVASGDVNGDGYDDIIIGARDSNEGSGSNSGSVYLNFGKFEGWTTDNNLSNSDASWVGERANSELSAYGGLSAGDFNGDGYDDILIGAWGDTEAGSGRGQTYLVLGNATGLSMDTPIGSVAYASWVGVTTENLGFEVILTEDVNGDGYNDILTAGYRSDEPPSDSGQVYLVLAQPRQFDNILSRHIHAGDKLSIGNNLKLEGETIRAKSQLYLDANTVHVQGDICTKEGNCLNDAVTSTTTLQAATTAGATTTDNVSIDTDASGITRIGNSSGESAIVANGSLFVEGDIELDGDLYGSGADVAELISGIDVEPADVVVIDPNNYETVIKSSYAYQQSVAGVVSTNPGAIFGEEMTPDGIPLALAGRVPVKATTQNGEINPGDYLTTSSTPGHAMRCTSYDACRGSIIGKALTPIIDGKVNMLVMLA